MGLLSDSAAFPRGKRISSFKDNDAKNHNNVTKRPKQAATASKKRGVAASSDFLFGTSSLSSPSASRKRPKFDSALSGRLPVGGGGVQTVAGTGIPSRIEWLTISKLARGTKLLGAVKVLRDDVCFVSLPMMMMGFIRREPKGPPLTQVLPPVNTIMAFYVLQIVDEEVSESQKKNFSNADSRKKRRVELSASPLHVNQGMRLDGFLRSNHSSRSSSKEDASLMIARGKIISIEDHGCIIDLGGIEQTAGIDSGGHAKAFLKFENIEGAYHIMEEKEREESEHSDDEEQDNELKIQKKSSSISNSQLHSQSLTRLLNRDRIYDFGVLPPEKNGRGSHSTILQLTLPSIFTMARVRTTNSNIVPSISSLMPGMLLEVQVEQHVKNGMCVSFMKGLYNGALDENHLGGWRYFGGDFDKSENKGKKISLNGGGNASNASMWWKNVFKGKHKQFVARIIAVDAATKIVRFSLNPQILALTGDHTSFPYPIGAIINNAHVIRVDPGIGALLALPSISNSDKISEETDSKRLELMNNILQLDKDLGNNLMTIPEFKAASTVHAAYVHISKSIDHSNLSTSKNGKREVARSDRSPETLFARHFSVNTCIESLRILSTSNLIDGIASCATAKSIIEAHVLTHDDIKPGVIYRDVPVIQLLDSGGVLVDLGIGIKGLIPATHLFDKASHGNLDTGGDLVLSGYRQKIRLAKYRVGNKVDVRCLTCDPSSKQCILTAKKTLLSTDIENPIVQYTSPSIEIGRVVAGFFSVVDEHGVTVTFYNNVHGRISSRSLAAELGVEDPRLNYSVGDVVMARVVECERRRCRYASQGDKDKYFYQLKLSLKTVIEPEKEAANDTLDSDKIVSSGVPLVAGSILERKRMKVLQLVNCLKRIDGVVLTGYAIVAVKSKFFTGISSNGSYLELKLPFDQLLDSYGDSCSKSSTVLDEIAKKQLTVGKKIDALGLILSVPVGSDTLPIVSLRKSLIDTMKGASTDDLSIVCPTPKSNLFMGEYVRGYVARIDERYGAFVRFLDGLTGLIPKLKKGLHESLYETILCCVTALDITSSPPKLLLKRASESEVAKKRKKLESKKPTSRTENFHAGDFIGDVKVVDINFARAKVYILGHPNLPKSRARIHVTMADRLTTNHELSKDEIKTKEDSKIGKDHPFYNWRVDDVISGVFCVAIDFRDEISYLELSNRSDINSVSSPVIFNNPCQLLPGLVISAIITSISNVSPHHGLWVQICPGITGFIPALELSNDPDVLNYIHLNFFIGSRISCCVMNSDASSLKVRPPPHPFPNDGVDNNAMKHDAVYLSVLLAAGNSSKSQPFVKPTKPERGELVIGRINKKIRMHNPPSLMLSLRGGFVGRCCITELADVNDWVNMPLGKISVNESPKNVSHQFQQRDVSNSIDYDQEDNNTPVNKSGNDFTEYHDGLYVKCRVLGNVKSKSAMVDLSLRDSFLCGEIVQESHPKADDTVHAYVVSTNKKGCFVRISRSVEGRIILKELSDDFIPDPNVMFPPGRLVVGKVKNVKKIGHDDNCSASAIVDMDLRESVLLTNGERLTLNDIKENSKYSGVVTRVEPYGVFVRIDNSDINGLAHVSECSDSYIKNIFDLYNPGDLVKLLVVKYNTETKRLSFSLKASNFIDDDSDNDTSSEEINDITSYSMNSNNDEKSLDSEDENFATKLAAQVKENNEDSDEEDNSSEDIESTNSEVESLCEGKESVPNAIDTNVGFTWEPLVNLSKNSKLTESSDDDSVTSSSSNDEERNDASRSLKSSHKSRKKAASKKREEDEISRREMSLADGTANDSPETCADFERLVASSPNNSEHWIKYMAFHLSLADIDSARDVANRACDRIEFHEEREKLNVWTALLTLDLKYGTQKSLQNTIDRACQQNNPKKVYLRVCELLLKSVDTTASIEGSSFRFKEFLVTPLTQQADDLFSKMCKKFKTKKSVWIAHFQYLLKTSRHEEAHALLKRSYQSLPKYKHVETMSKFAQMEFEFGSPERGRTIFNSLLKNNPKRMDLLFVNVDKEIKFGDISNARALFDHVVKSVMGDDDKQKIKYSDKQMKSLFKKWYQMEEEYGNEESQEAVKEKARAFVMQSKCS